MQEFYHVYHKSYNAYIDYMVQESKWDNNYEINKQKSDKESVRERLIQPPMETLNYQQQRPAKNKDRGAR